MSEIDQVSREETLNYNLDSFGSLTLEKLVKWTVELVEKREAIRGLADTQS